MLKVIHYGTGGVITATSREFSTLCGRKFDNGSEEIMQSGYTGAQNTSCKNCKAKLLAAQKKSNHRDAIMRLIDQGKFSQLRIIN